MPAPPNMVKKALDTWQNSPPSPEIDTSIGDPYNNPYTQDYLPPEEEQAQKQAAIAKVLLDQSYWKEDIGHGLDVTAKNWAANLAGIPADTIGLMLMAYASDPIKREQVLQMTGAKDIWDIPNMIPGNANDFAKKFGGDPEHASMLATAFLPGPTEGKAVLATLGGMLAYGGKVADNVTFGATKLEKFLEMEKKMGMKPMDFRLVEETGWVRGLDGNVKFVIADKDAVYKPIKLVEGDNIVKLGQVLDHPKLYEAYPELADVKVNLKAEMGKDGKLQLVHTRQKDPKTGEYIEPVANFQFNRGKNPKINVFQARSADDVKSSLLHEAQHWIQEVEGWSTGASSVKESDFLRYGNQLFGAKMLRQLDQDELADPRVVKGWIDEVAETYGEVPPEIRKDLMEMARIQARFDPEEIAMTAANIQSSVEQEMVRTAHVWNYLLKKGDASMDEMFTAALDRLDASGLEELAKIQQIAYKYKLGEVEARLTQLGRNWDEKMWSKFSDPVETMLIQEAGGPSMIPPGTRLTDDVIIGETGKGIQNGVVEQGDVVDFPRGKTKHAQEGAARLRTRDEAFEAMQMKQSEYTQKWGKTPWLFIDEDPFYLQRVAFRKGVSPDKLLAEFKADTAALDEAISTFNKSVDEWKTGGKGSSE